MKVSVCYDDQKFVDIIWVPDCIEDIEKVQTVFLKWMFNKKNDHKYWVYENNQKIGCSYGTDAFIEYLNEFVLKNSFEKAKILKHCDFQDEKMEKEIFF